MFTQVQTELVLVSQRKDKLLAAKSQEEQISRKKLKELQAEKESLLLVRQLLAKQKENSETSSENWVLVPRDGDNLE